MQDAPALVAHARLADERIERAMKIPLADVAPLLALNIGDDHQRYGDVPQEILLKMVRAEQLDEETFALLCAGMRNLVAALAEVTRRTDDLQERRRIRPAGRDGCCAGCERLQPGRDRSAWTVQNPAFTTRSQARRLAKPRRPRAIPARHCVGC